MGCLGPCSALGIFLCKSSPPRRQPVVCVTWTSEWEPPQGDYLESTLWRHRGRKTGQRTPLPTGMEVWRERTEWRQEYGVMNALGSPCLLLAIIARETEVWLGAESVALTWCLLYLSPCSS